MEQVLTVFDVIALVSSIASLILALVAIWLSFKFFEQSTAASEKTNEASKGITSSVERLEKLFDKLYSDTFSVMKDTVTDMRKHLWSDNKDDGNISKIEEETEKKAEKKIEEIKTEIRKELNNILRKQHIDKKVTEGKIESIKDELSTLFEKAISKSRNVESKVREETLREFILRKLELSQRRNKRNVVSNDFLPWAKSENLDTHKLFREIEEMEKEGILRLSESQITHGDVKIELI